MTDLFSYKSAFPHAPGYKRPGTSKDAAERMKRRDKPLREKVLDLLRSGSEMTADEAAQALGETVLSIRPRVAQLNKLGLIVKTGYTRANASGLQATVWRIMGEYEGRKLIGVD